ncbi:cytochrome b [Photobacterium sp. OFAV2-7]|uniref:cytochrome b n=1 Tax=Photobacterium sp. OFAV2-7 TaxID=2917748 RepID=UPI001EF5E573|nr:cytochrome b/b6 domain-containing protein [Photobacterium sp. OFAV2-7]MCG7584920.1 cytochrome b/b6 domain-containing protein [Photobacterium sp. OFAV2-7]
MNDKFERRQQTTGYDKGYKWLHWLMAVLVILMFMATFGFEQAKTEADKIEMLMGHSTIGSVAFILFLTLFSKRFIFKSPRPKHNLDVVTNMAARVGHSSLYVLLFYVPVTGFLVARAHELPVFWLGQVNISELSEYSEVHFDMIRNLHELGVKALMVLVVIHIGAAAFHGLAKKDGVFGAMWLGKKA